MKTDVVPFIMEARKGAATIALLVAVATTMQTPARALPLDLSASDEAAIANASVAFATAGDPSSAFEVNFPASAKARTMAELEKTFWVCDYIATIYGPDKVDAVGCSTATDELKRAKFGGDFEKLLNWWRANKIAQHAAMDRADMEAASGAADVAENPDSI